ncbi:uncharacterized protein EI90DRAFT_78252 [Cantharellus anzutake]|uniref:uncharacterized protein n=1 Tax=Cantharellus anzutake TaxID=1750568 RepID=UPI00190319A0|nr:uncharacterized protein EI90DRAFT_78252 [Cantharellus anzutake]KAF8336850.1 hypothetical protein EI90DRAFT_78252 [Cantharellus anzutake]
MDHRSDQTNKSKPTVVFFPRAFVHRLVNRSTSKQGPSYPTPKFVKILLVRTANMLESIAVAYHEVSLQDFISATSDAPYDPEMIKIIAEDIRSSETFTEEHQSLVSALAHETLAALKSSLSNILRIVRERCQEFVSNQQTPRELPPIIRKRRSANNLPIVLQVQHHTTIFPNYLVHSEPTIAYQEGTETDYHHGYSEEFQSMTRPDKIVLRFPLPRWAHRLHAKAEDAMAAQGNRRHVLGILANHSNITFWYFDRAGGFYSAPIDFTNRPLEFLPALVQLNLSSAFALGLEPIIESPDPWEALIAMKRTTIRVQGIPFLIQKTLHVSHDLEGRGLILLSARQEANHEPTTIPEDVILKMSWEDPSSRASDFLYRHAEQYGVQG